MIEFLRGQIAYAETDYAVIDVNGIGYQVYCANPYRFSATDEVTIYTHHHVREDAVALYGFATRDELQLFRQLLEVSGIGPKVALGILAGGSPNDVLLAIQQENLTFLTRLPGIGKKTAQRMILDLKDRTKSMIGAWEGSPAVLESTGHSAFTGSTAGAWAEAKEALRNLGYSEQELSRAWSVLKERVSDDDSTDVILKKALQILYQT
jgi:Holliday junction DNA helicase RuvA